MVNCLFDLGADSRAQDEAISGVRRKRWWRMKKNKKFDCVQMKWAIQQQVRKEFAGVPEDQAREIQMRQVAENPILGPLYQRLASEKTSATKR
jgi:hypothetical protein